MSPLLLSQRHAAKLDVILGCRLPPPLPGTRQAPTRLVLATTRSPSAGGLRLVSTGGRLVFESGGRTVARLSRSPEGSGALCRTELAVSERHWSYADAQGETLASGDLADAPVVNALITGLDVRRPGLSVRVTTEVYGAKTAPAQRVAGLLAVVLAGLSIGMASFGRRVRRVHARRVSAGLRELHPVDVVVVAALGVWWIIGPAFFDDGWVRARQQNYAASGSFIEYFIGWGGVLPGAYWLDWIEHWLVEATGSVPLLRLVPLAAGLAGWALCRCALAQATGRRNAHGPVVISTMAATYLVSFTAWGMTLRPEPVVAVLVIGALVAVSRFVQRPSVGPLAVVGILAALALTAHPTGIVVLAPLLAAGPGVLTWARTRGPELWLRLGAVTVASCAVAVVLFFVQSDLARTRQETSLARSLSAHSSNWRDELNRYTLLSSQNFGTPLRRLAVAFLLLAVVGFLTRSSRGRRAAADLPVLSVVLALALLTVTPSKWPWHFGALIGLGAVALATEVGRLAEEGRQRNWYLGLRPVGAAGLVLAANAWAWAPLTSWVTLDLHTLHWSNTAGALVRFGSHITPGSLKDWVAFLAAVMFVWVTWSRWRHGRWGGSAGVWRLSLWMVTLVAVPALVYTGGYFVRDTQVSSGWTLTRQNLDSLRGRSTCGLGDALTVPRATSIRALQPLQDAVAAPASLVRNAVLPRGSRPPFGRPQVWGSWGVAAIDRPLVSPWFALPTPAASNGVGIYVAGSLTGRDRLWLEWGARSATGVERLERDGVTASVAAASQQDWALLPSRLLPSRPAAADALRIVAAAHEPPGAWFGVSAPVQYRRETVASELGADPGRVLISATLSLYFPCASRPPVVARGIAASPETFVVAADSSIWPIGDRSSPFNGILDVNGVFQLPLDDRRWNPSDVAVYVTRPLPRGEAALPPARE